MVIEIYFVKAPLPHLTHTECTRETTCNGNGDCDVTGKCACDFGWGGIYCATCMTPFKHQYFSNLYALIFILDNSNSSGHWTWFGGNYTSEYSTVRAVYPAHHGEIGSPGFRRIAPTAVVNDTMYLFGGYGYGNNSNVYETMNDLWAFNVSSGNWTWVAGSSNSRKYGVYIGDDAQPGGRTNTAMWATKSGVIYVFGGIGCDKNCMLVFIIYLSIILERSMWRIFE